MIYVLFNKQYTQMGRAQPSQTQTISCININTYMSWTISWRVSEKKIEDFLKHFACDALNDLLLCCPEL